MINVKSRDARLCVYTIGIILLSCSSTAQVETARLEIQTEQVIAEFDKVIDCKTQVDSDVCEEVIKKAKRIMKESIELNKKKDLENINLVSENQELQQDSDTLLKLKLWAGGLSLAALLTGLGYLFLPHILNFIARMKPL